MRKNTHKGKGRFPAVPAVLLGVSALLLIGSTVGSTRAALTYYSENYEAQIQVSRIGVTLEENGKPVSSRDFTEDSQWSETKGTLLEHLLKKGETLQPGKRYEEALAVSNSGSIDSFVRQDLPLAHQVMEYDNVVDELFNKVKKELIQLIGEHRESGEFCIDLLMVAKYFERIGDHAVNVAEWVQYSLTGKKESA